MVTLNHNKVTIAALTLLAILFILDATTTIIGLKNPLHYEQNLIPAITFQHFGIVTGLILLSLFAYSVVTASLLTTKHIVYKYKLNPKIYTTTIALAIAIKTMPVINNTALIIRNGGI